MKFAADFRYIARESLRGKWTMAVIVGLIATLLGGAGNIGPKAEFRLGEAGPQANFSVAGQTIISTSGGLDPHVKAWMIGGAIYVFTAVMVLAALYFILGGVVGVGYARFNLDLTGAQELSFNTMFAYLNIWNTAAVCKLLRSVYVLLWSLLLFIPGIIASYRYAMTDYILAEHPELTAGEAIERSKELMAGNKWRLFCLDLSFIGWDILCGLTLGIGTLWLNPYKNAAKAAFYRDISGPTYQYGA